MPVIEPSNPSLMKLFAGNTSLIVALPLAAIGEHLKLDDPLQTQACKTRVVSKYDRCAQVRTLARHPDRAT